MTLSSGKRTNVISFMSARGGVGKTALSACAALLGEEGGLHTALLDLDIQFGDIAFVFDKRTSTTLLDLCMNARIDEDRILEYACVLSPDLDLYISGGSPEHADFVVPHAATLVRALSDRYDLVVVNTGSFWTSLHIEVAELCSTCFLVFDAKASSLRATLRARDLFVRLGLPPSRIEYVMNQTLPRKEIDVFDSSMLLGTDRISFLPHAGEVISDLMSIGRARGLLEEAASFSAVLHKMLIQRNILDEDFEWRKSARSLGWNRTTHEDSLLTTAGEYR